METLSTNKIINGIKKENATLKALPGSGTPNDSNINEQPEISLSDYDIYRVTKEKNISQPEPTIQIGGAAVASPGNITGISALAKAGKTAFTSVVIAGAISLDGAIDGFSDLKVLPNPDGKAVIHMDTEQSEADQQYNLVTVLKRARIEETPDYYRSYNIRQVSLGNYQDVTNKICQLCFEEFNGIHLIVIDGGADYISSVNDEEKAYNIVQYFIHLSIKYDCPVIIIVHQNPGSDKERGHFGSEIQRKCYGLLSITKQGDISTLQPKIMRKAGHEDVPLINYKYCKNVGYHVETSTSNPSEEKERKNRDRLFEVAKEVFAPPHSFKHKEAVSKIMQSTSKGLSTAKTMLANMEGFGFIEQGLDGNYRIKMDKVNLGQNGSI